MKAGLKIVTVLVTAASCAFAGAANAADPGLEGAVQAIRQAQDPSSAITAFAGGFSVGRDNPRFYDAFVSRMVDLGLPEMAFHQAQTLTTLQSNNGLAWGVVAYVDARQGQMDQAISAINRAGQFAPHNQFVQHTAGELVAWYDFKADKTTVSDATKDGLAQTRGLLQTNPAFTQAYNSAQKAYQEQTEAVPTTGSPAATPPSGGQAQAAPVFSSEPEATAPLADDSQVAAPVYGAPLVPPDDYSENFYNPDYSGAYMDWGPDYGYDWEPGWGVAAPWSWWEPYGYWGGCNFFPFGASFAFGDFDHFNHFHHGGFWGHDGHFGHHGDWAHNGDHGFWHGAHGRNGFYGAPARPGLGRVGSQVRSHTGLRSGFVGNGHSWQGASRVARPAVSGLPGRSASPASALSVRHFNTRPAAPAGHSTWTRPVYGSRSASVPRSAWTPRAFGGRAFSYSTPRYSAPARGNFGAQGSWRSAPPAFSGHSFAAPRGGFHGGSFGGGFRTGGGISHGGGFGGGGSHGGGFHGGSFGGGGSHGGGHR